MKKFLLIIIIFITSTGYNDSNIRLTPVEKRLLIEKSLDSTEKKIERINKILDDPHKLYEIKNK